MFSNTTLESFVMTILTLKTHNIKYVNLFSSPIVIQSFRSAPGSVLVEFITVKLVKLPLIVTGYDIFYPSVQMFDDSK